MKSNQTWVRLLAYVTGQINRELLLRNEYLAAENHILRAHLPKRLRLTDEERLRLADIGKRLGRRLLAQVACTAKPETILAWYRRLVAEKFDGSKQRVYPGRPRLQGKTEKLILRLARENTTWGYDRIAGALANLSVKVSAQTIGNVLRRHGIPPAPKRGQVSHWSDVLAAKMLKSTPQPGGLFASELRFGARILTFGQLLVDVRAFLVAPRRFTQELKLIHGGGLERDRRLPAPGTVVERNYRGAMVKVTIGKQEFVYEGKAYPSLSAVAQIPYRFSPDGRFLFYSPDVRPDKHSDKKRIVHLLEVSTGMDRPWIEDPSDSIRVAPGVASASVRSFAKISSAIAWCVSAAEIKARFPNVEIRQIVIPINLKCIHFSFLEH